MPIRVASCCCGQLTAQVNVDPVRVSICHCHACQQRTGSVFGVQARFPREQVNLSGQGTEYIRVGDAGGRAKLTFCPSCGSTVYFVLLGQEELIVIPVGAFADADFPAPEVSVYEERMHTWVALPETFEHIP